MAKISRARPIVLCFFAIFLISLMLSGIVGQDVLMRIKGRMVHAQVMPFPEMELTITQVPTEPPPTGPTPVGNVYAPFVLDMVSPPVGGPTETPEGSPPPPTIPPPQPTEKPPS